MFTLVVGGSASGKSEFAEKLLPGDGERVYLATMEAAGKEALARIRRHRKLREGKGFETIECPVNIGNCLDACKGKYVLLEDLPNLLANEMFSPHGSSPAGALTEQILNLVRNSAGLVCVTGILTADGRKYDESTAAYLRALAEIERVLAENADRVIEVVCGVGNEIKNKEDLNITKSVQELYETSCGFEVKNRLNPDTRPVKIKESAKEHRMIFVTGPMYSGKKNYIKSALRLSDEEFEKCAVWGVQDLVDRIDMGDDLPETLADQLALKDIVIADEIGCGVVPLSKAEREKREKAGRLACVLAERADTVIRVVCGCPQVLKG